MSTIEGEDEKYELLRSRIKNLEEANSFRKENISYLKEKISYLEKINMELTKKNTNLQKKLNLDKQNENLLPKINQNLKCKTKSINVVLFGKNGIGKSSLIRALIPELKNDDCEIAINDKEIKSCTKKTKMYIYKYKDININYLIQEDFLILKLKNIMKI